MGVHTANLDKLDKKLRQISHSKKRLNIGFADRQNNIKALIINYGTATTLRQPFFDKAIEQVNTDMDAYIKQHKKVMDLNVNEMYSYLRKRAKMHLQQQIQKYGLIDTGDLYNSVKCEVV